MPDFDLSLPTAIALFLLAAAVVGVTGTRIVGIADRIADRTGLGEALVGGMLLGGATSLSGVVTSVTAAAEGYPQLAISNAIGGITVQTAFLVIADMVYVRANLEHAAASLTNLVLGALLIALLAVPLVATTAPPWGVVYGIHPVTFVLFGAYLLGMRLAGASRNEPMWRPRSTVETRLDTPAEDSGGGPVLTRLLIRFALLALIVGSAGFVLARLGMVISDRSGLSQSLVGSLMTAVATSTPELVTTVAAVRRNALTLAVGGIIGGNTFDVLLVALSDIGYRDGSIYHAIAQRELFLFVLGILMTAVLLLGMLRRQRYGIGRIGFESFIVLLLYLGGVAIQIGQG